MTFTLKCPSCGHVLGNGYHAQKHDPKTGKWTDGELTSIHITAESDPPVDTSHTLAKNAHD